MDSGASGGSLPPREAYRLWAPTYEAETAVSALEARIVGRLVRPLAGLALLDAGCGTGRRLAGGEARLAVGVDLVPEMMMAGRRSDPARRLLTAGSLEALPFADGVFDVVWCRLVLGHLPDPGPAYAEFARVGRPGARLLVSDFHPAAARAGHTRTFRDREGRRRTVEHHVHTEGDHRAAARPAGWTPSRSLDALPGAEERPFWERAGRLDRFEAERDLPLVLALEFRL